MSALDWLLPADAFAFHCPNGGSRNVVEAVNLKRQGLKAGVPDILLCHRGRMVGLELKAKDGRLSEAQNLTFARLRDAGIRVEVARDYDEALRRIADMGIPLKHVETTHDVASVFREETRRRK